MTWNSSIVSKSITISDLVPGESSVVSVRFGNTSTGGGVETFRPQDPSLDWAYINGVDSFTKSCGGVSQNFTEYVSPYSYGDKYQIHEYTFNIPITAPNNPGNHTLKYQLVIVHDGNGAHEPIGAIATINIIIRQPANAQLISNTFPAQMEVAERGTAQITFKNTGRGHGIIISGLKRRIQTRRIFQSRGIMSLWVFQSPQAVILRFKFHCVQIVMQGHIIRNIACSGTEYRIISEISHQKWFG